jgi:hypothetical protein
MRDRSRLERLAFVVAPLTLVLLGCAHTGRLQNVSQTASPPADTLQREHRQEAHRAEAERLRALFGGDTLIGFIPGTGDSAHRYLGRLRGGFVADTLNFILLGDNRPGFRTTRLYPEAMRIKRMFSLNPFYIVRGLVNIPWILIKGMYPDLAIVRDVSERIENMPRGGREHQMVKAITTRIDSLKARGQEVAAIVNTGDLVYDGRYPKDWERFLRIWGPLTSRVPYFAVAGNHERTDTPDGVENWRTATGLPVGGDRLYYCFDSADGWMRFIALDTNPIVDPMQHWTREVEVKYSDEEFTWLVQRVKEHTGPVFVMMHHPPFSAGVHHGEWERDSVLMERRARMVKALHEAGIAVLATGHEHAYERALITWPDAVLIVIGTGGAGSPLHDIPPPAQTAQLFSQYKIAGSVVKPENVFSAKAFHFIHVRLWFGGGEFYAYAVDDHAKTTLMDKVQIDLTRYGVPKIDQHKIPIAAAKGPSEPATHETPKGNAPLAAKDQGKPVGARPDSIAASERILSKPPPGKKVPLRRSKLGKRSTAAASDSAADGRGAMTTRNRKTSGL